MAAFEPALDYIVVKIPRWPFDKFASGDRLLGTQMKATGEVMAIDRTFEAALQKAVRSLEFGKKTLLWEDRKWTLGTDINTYPLEPTDLRLWAVMAALRRGIAPQAIHDKTKIDLWFLDKMVQVREMRQEWKIKPVYKMVDTCAAEFDAATPYFYSTYETENEAIAVDRKKAVVIGSGPIRIGQGIEFDYCSVHAARALKEAGYQSIMINSNPETVSTDFDTSDRLYFESLDEESIRDILDNENSNNIDSGYGDTPSIVQFGGPTRWQGPVCRYWAPAPNASTFQKTAAVSSNSWATWASRSRPEQESRASKKR